LNEAERDLVRYRLERANEALADAELLLSQDRLPAATNRTYYAMFYAVVALLITKGFSSSRHSGVIGLFHREFVKTRQFPVELAKYIDLAFDERLEGDYGEYVQFERADLDDLLQNAHRFVSKTVELIGSLD
jgi:uncharacterized protein (UPF0332 family)